MKCNYENIISLIILSLVILLIIYSCSSVSIEHFEDKFDDFEKYDELYDEEFVELYEIIYRDYEDIDFDTKIVYNHTMVKNNNEPNILVCGSGIGKLCKKIKEKYKNVMGVDISENMLKKSQVLFPNIKFIRGNIAKEKIFEVNKFSHIYMDERTFYYNDLKIQEDIIKNIYLWLKPEGYFIMNIYDPSKLQVASRYYSSNYVDNKGNKHGFTYLNDFSHDCYYIKDEENSNVYNYYDKAIFDTGDKRIKKTTFYIQPKEKIYDIILNNGFEVIHIENIRTQIVGGYELAIFKKKKNIITVEELEKKNIIE